MSQHQIKFILVLMALLIVPICALVPGVVLLGEPYFFDLELITTMFAGCWCWIALPRVTALITALIRQRDQRFSTPLWGRAELILRMVVQAATGLGFFFLALTLVGDRAILVHDWHPPEIYLLGLLIKQINIGVFLLAWVSWGVLVISSIRRSTSP
jgi:hypothetical protein